MTLLPLPWWLDYDNPPADDVSAQAVWILGQWHFIPFAFGRVPLRRMCGSVQEAHQEAAAFERAVQAKEAEAEHLEASGHAEKAKLLRKAIADFRARCAMFECAVDDADIGDGFRIYAVGGDPDSEPCIVVADDGRALRDAMPSYEEAVEQARGFAAPPPP